MIDTCHQEAFNSWHEPSPVVPRRRHLLPWLYLLQIGRLNDPMPCLLLKYLHLPAIRLYLGRSLWVRFLRPICDGLLKFRCRMTLVSMIFVVETHISWGGSISEGVIFQDLRQVTHGRGVTLTLEDEVQTLIDQLVFFEVESWIVMLWFPGGTSA